MGDEVDGKEDRQGKTEFENVQKPPHGWTLGLRTIFGTLVPEIVPAKEFEVGLGGRRQRGPIKRSPDFEMNN
jgi:hypothetical protein